MNLKYELEKRYSHLYSSVLDNYTAELEFFIKFINENPTIYGLMSEAKSIYPYKEEYSKIDHNYTRILYEDSKHRAVVHLYWIEKVIEKGGDTVKGKILLFFRQKNNKQALFTETYVKPIVTYLIDVLDNWSANLYLVQKYKRRTEWFLKNYLCEKYNKAEKSSYEQVLEDDFVLFIFDQGVEYIFTTPKSESGRADVVSKVSKDQLMVSEIKVLDKTKNYGKRRIIDGFSQIIKYTNDYQVDSGYVIIFNVDNIEVSFDFQNQDGLAYVNFNNKIYYFIVINIAPNIPASKIGKTNVLMITKDELTKSVEI